MIGQRVSGGGREGKGSSSFHYIFTTCFIYFAFCVNIYLIFTQTSFYKPDERGGALKHTWTREHYFWLHRF